MFNLENKYILIYIKRMPQTEYQKKWLKDNPEKVAATRKKYYQDNKEKIQKERAKHYKDNKPVYQAQNTKYYQEHREEILVQKKEYYKKNKEICKAKQNYRTNKKKYEQVKAQLNSQQVQTD
jgi:hypothetical protein